MGRNKKLLEGKNPFKLRRRLLKNGRSSLFIDYYKDGKHHYEFLRLYLLPETSEQNRRENGRTLHKAEEALRSKWESLIINDKGKKSTSRDLSLTEFIDFLVLQYKKDGKAGHRHLETAKANLNLFRKNIKLMQIDRQFCIDYHNWLKNEYKTSSSCHLSPTASYVYFKKFGVILSNAYRMGFMDTNLWNLLDKKIKGTEPEKKKRFLTYEELNLLSSTPYKPYPIIRLAFLFSCFSGLRISDIRNLKWKDIEKKENDIFIGLEMKKTKKKLSLPLSNRANLYLPEKIRDTEIIFTGLPSSSNIQKHLNKWKDLATIEGRIHFHVARHTFATLLLTAGSDLFTASSLLGHSDIRMTQRYANIIDGKKFEAVKMMERLIEN